MTRRTRVILVFLGIACFLAWLEAFSEIEGISTGTSTFHVPSSTTSVTLSSTCVPPPDAIPLPPRHFSIFKPGEKFVFVIKYEFISAGEATMEVQRGDPVKCRPTLRFLSVAKSNGFVDAFFVVRDFNCSIVDEASVNSVGFIQNLREGHYRVKRNTTIDYFTHEFRYEKDYKEKITVKTGPITEPVSDILSSFFITRTLPLEPGGNYEIKVFSDGDYYPLKIKVFPKIETIEVPAGRFSCLKLEPGIIGDAIFKAKEGKMTIWLTNDDKKMPVLIRSKVAVGAFDARLSSFSYGE